MTLHPSIRIEGGLLGPDLIDQLRSGELPGQKLADFAARPPALSGGKPSVRGDRVRDQGPLYGNKPHPKRSLTDEVARAFADARSLWSIFQHRCERLPPGDTGTSMTRASWVEPFLGLLDYDLIYNRRAYELDGLTFAISHRAGTAEDAPPVHIVGVGQGLGQAPATGRPRLAPHALLQEYLNRTEALWGVVTNGTTLRLLRDSTNIRRQAYIEFDLAGMLEEQRFEDFEALYRLLHRSRLPAATGDADDCLIERYYTHGVEQGGRVRERLRDGVEQCIKHLANGFLLHPANQDLRERVQADSDSAGRITERDLYRHLLVLVYRFLFLLVAEDRGLIGASPLYRGHYGIGRLRGLLDRPASDTDHDDLWHSLRVVWRVLAVDHPEEALDGRPLAALLDLSALNGDLFTLGLFDDAAIANRDLLAAFDHLARYQERAGPRRRVNYAALDVEELGSVYESLLDRQPVIQSDSAGRLAFQLVMGSERKSTGSFYTPPDLVAELVRSALTPILEERLEPGATRTERERAILSIRVCDPACGSGHFLLAASRRLGKELARIRSGDDEPAPERVREAIRDVVAHSIYGVDRNPLAVDLCRVALWIESHDPGKPLSFLDHRIRCGNSLIGVFDLDVLANGIPDVAFTPLGGDDTQVARLLKTQNRDERRDGQYRLPWDSAASVTGFANVALQIDAIADDSPEAIRRKRALFERRHDDPTRQRQYLACHLWTAAFFQPLRSDEPAITTATLADHLSGRSVLRSALKTAVHLADEHRFFHWPLEFPEVFCRADSGGFDVVLGNPPWERVKLQEKEFFAGRHTPIANARNAAERKKMIHALALEDPALHRSFRSALRNAEGYSRFLRDSGRYPLCGRGDINLYAVFAELIRCLVNRQGRTGCVLPTGIATDDTTKLFFQDVVNTGSLVSLFDFENKGIFFPQVHSSYKFCLFTDGHGARSAGDPARFVFFAHDTKELRSPDRVFALSSQEIELLNPNTQTCPIFRSLKDAELTKAIYRRVPILAPESTHGASLKHWNPRFSTMFHMSNDSDLFRTREDLEDDGWRLTGNVFRREDATGRQAECLPLYEAKMVHHFDHRWATHDNGKFRDVSYAAKEDPQCSVLPRYWVDAREVYLRTADLPKGLRDALRARNERRIVFGVAYLLFAHWVLRAFGDSPTRALESIFPSWLSLVARHRFAGAVSPVGMVMRGDGPACIQPLNHSYVAAEPVNDLSPEELDVDDLSRVPWWTRDDIKNSGTMWYAADHKGVSALLEFAADNAHLAEFVASAPPLDRAEDAARCAEELLVRTSPRWLMGWRRTSRSTDDRTAICTVSPLTGVGDSHFLMRPDAAPPHVAMLAACLDSLVCDYTLRQALGGANVSFFVMKQIPVLPPDAYSESDMSFILPRTLELTYTAWDQRPFAQDCGWFGPPFRWDNGRRFRLRAELDAAFFDLYLPSTREGDWKPARRAEGANQDETAEQLAALRGHFAKPREAVTYILQAFPILERRDAQEFDEYRTKRVILEIYDAMQEAKSRGESYRSLLDPPPADPRCCCPPLDQASS